MIYCYPSFKLLFSTFLFPGILCIHYCIFKTSMFKGAFINAELMHCLKNLYQFNAAQACCWVPYGWHYFFVPNPFMAHCNRNFALRPPFQTGGGYICDLDRQENTREFLNLPYPLGTIKPSGRPQGHSPCLTSLHSIFPRQNSAVLNWSVASTVRFIG